MPIFNSSTKIKSILLASNTISSAYLAGNKIFSNDNSVILSYPDDCNVMLTNLDVGDNENNSGLCELNISVPSFYSGYSFRSASCYISPFLSIPQLIQIPVISNLAKVYVEKNTAYQICCILNVSKKGVIKTTYRLMMQQLFTETIIEDKKIIDMTNTAVYTNLNT